jgi:hypothetical protein
MTITWLTTNSTKRATKHQAKKYMRASKNKIRKNKLQNEYFPELTRKTTLTKNIAWKAKPVAIKENARIKISVWHNFQVNHHNPLVTSMPSWQPSDPQEACKILLKTKLPPKSKPNKRWDSHRKSYCGIETECINCRTRIVRRNTANIYHRKH